MALRVDTHHVVHSGRCLLIFWIEPLYAFALAAAISELDLQRSDPGLQLLGQRVIGCVHRCKERVAAIARDLKRIELRRLANLDVPRPVRMPALATIEHQLVVGAVSGSDTH